MKIYNTAQFEKLKINPVGLNDFNKIKPYKFYPKDKNELVQIVKERINKEGFNCDLNDIDVSNITDMNYMFANSDFNGDISNWNVSNVTNINNMFEYSQFNGDISKWNVSNMTDMSDMFYKCSLENNSPKWYKKII